MSTTLSLPVLVPKANGQRWSCHSCGDCCRTLVGHLFDDERARLDEQGWQAKLNVAPYVRIGRESVLNKRADGACVFLDDQNRCRIHAEFGESAKPLACRVFPFSLRPVAGAWQASLRFDCPSVIASDGSPLSQHKPWLGELAGRMAHRVSSRDQTVNLQGQLQADPDEIEAVTARFVRWLRDDERSLRTRLIGAARLTATLEAATLQSVRGPRFLELLDLLVATLPDECRTKPGMPTARQAGLLRQLVFAHTEHVSLAERRAWVGRRLGRRWVQLRRAKRFHRGVGLAPEIVGEGSGVSFDKIEAVKPVGVDDAVAVDDLLLRYLIARIESRSVYAAGYYGWSMFPGFAALWLSIAATGWLARYVAAAADRSRLTLADVGRALGVIDRAVTRLPALGTVAERFRAAYLLKDDGVASLLTGYAITDG